MSARIRATMKAAAGRLTPVERLMLVLLESHDRTKFNPSVDKLAEDLYGRADRRTREEARQILKQLEEKGEIRREYREKPSGASDYSHIWLKSDDEAIDDGYTPSSDGRTPSLDGRTPSSDGRTPGPKTKRTSKTNQAKRVEVPSGMAEDVDYRAMAREIESKVPGADVSAYDVERRGYNKTLMAWQQTAIAWDQHPERDNWPDLKSFNAWLENPRRLRAV